MFIKSLYGFFIEIALQTGKFHGYGY